MHRNSTRDESGRPRRHGLLALVGMVVAVIVMSVSAMPAGALANTTISGQYGYIQPGWGPGAALIDCRVGASTVTTSISLRTTVNPPVGTALSQMIYARAWIARWDATAGVWRNVGWLNGAQWASGGAAASDLGYFPAVLRTGAVSVSSGSYYRIGFEAYWYQAGTAVAHKYYFGSAGEYRAVNAAGYASGLTTPYCQV